MVPMIPISSCLLARQDKATDTRARELHQARRDMLAAPSLWIDQDAHRLREGRGLHGPLAVVQMPNVELLDDLTAVGIVRLDLVDAFDGIAATSARRVTANQRRRCSIVESNTRCAIE
jgi:hypothetical protein